ncbi:MAG TPA: beta-galactosidase trimerization domain-containing protein, partial [Roseiflexaceae bacterium]|nr:beta-galactosidase trimerization domain-containing protein [Roseiflexaceae bacterium]
HLLRFALAAERRFMERCTRAIRTIAPDTGIFYNSRLKVEANPAIGNRVELDNFTHIEIESLPGGFWGYDHFPLFVRHFATYDRELLAMTGRFHTTWGDFGGLRNRAALEFECFQALAHGAKISIGDQLHPRGRLDPAVYKRIGEVFAAVEAREQFSAGSTALAEIGVLSSKGGISSRPGDGNDFGASDTGALHVLEQLHHQFAILDRSCDLSQYAVVILPDTVLVDAALADKLRTYVAGGGRLLVSDRSGLDTERGDFAFDDLLGVHYAGPAPFAPDYMALEEVLSHGI